MRKLTPRLQKVADLVPVGTSMADIGTDHGYIPIYLLQSGKMKRAIASDIHEGPLVRARENVSSAGLLEAVSLRLGGGLAPISKGEVEGVTICGMGGLMIRDILAADAEKAHAFRWLVLQPQNHVGELKQYVCREGWTIETECLVEDEGQLYEIMKLVPGMARSISELEGEIGVTPSYRQNPLFSLHVEKLIHKRDILIHNTSPNSSNERTRANRERAVEEKQLLEQLLAGKEQMK